MKPMRLIAILLLGWLGGQVHADTTWTLATGYGLSNFHTLNVMAFADDVAKLSGNALRIEVRPDAKLFKLTDIPPAVMSGKIQAGETLLSTMVKDFPLAGADSLPFVVNGYDDAKRLWSSQRPLLQKSLEAKGMRVLYAVPWPPQGLFTRNEVRIPNDLKSLKMRTYNATTVQIANAMGATPVDLGAGEVEAALLSGKIDSLITSPVTGAESKVWTTLHYFYDLKAWIPKNAVLVNAQAFDALPPPVREAVLKAAEQAEVRGWQASEREASNAINLLKTNKMITEPTPTTLRQRLNSIGERFSLEWVRNVGQDAMALFIPYYAGTEKRTP